MSNRGKALIFIITSAFVSCFQLQQKCLSRTPSIATQSLREGMKQTWRSSQTLPEKAYIGTECEVTDDGVIYNPVISKSSGNYQYDAECLEALCGLSPLKVAPHNWVINLSLDHVVGSFGNLENLVRPSLKAEEIERYLQSHSLKNKVVVHKIPYFMLLQYPDLLKKEDIFDEKNLIEIEYEPPSEKTYYNEGGRQPQYVWAIRTINGYWTKERYMYEPVTRESILRHAADLVNVSGVVK